MAICISLLSLLNFIAFAICFYCYLKEESVKSIIGWIITSAIMSILQLAGIMFDKPFFGYYVNICIYVILFAMAIYALIRCKNKKDSELSKK